MRLLFLHAAGSSGDEWVQQRLAFAGEHEVRTPDLPGHGAGHMVMLERPREFNRALAEFIGKVSSGLRSPS